ncbi:MAG TPA: class II fructose-1,6-bisphosphate aldolase [Haploplasma sp.]|nr:class II fructose-1,6-bisphosphate aldolase [Haploplasma sp.]
MAIVSAKEMLLKARKEGYGVAQININNLEWIKAVLETVEELQSPVILGVSEGAAKYMGGYKNVVDMVQNIHDTFNVTVPVAIHLDHGTYDGAFKALEAGFTSIMFDGSHYPFDENLAKTKEVVAACHAKGVSVEAEVGSIGGEEDGVVGTGELADPEECRIIAATGVDMFAAGIGNIHGKYPANWAGLNFEVLSNIQDVTNNIPLVLHGGTGIPADQIAKAVSLGVAKINVNTECQLAFAEGVRKYIEAKEDLTSKGFDPRKLLAPGVEGIKTVVREKIALFGSENKA